MSEEKKEVKKSKITVETLEIIVVIMLGITAAFTAWASWIGSLHGGNQATNYTQSNNLSADGNSLWNEASQYYMQDMMTWNSISQLQIDYAFAQDKNDQDEMDRIEYKMEQIISDNCTEEFQEAINWALEQEDYATPFEMEGFVDSYYANAQATLEESSALLEQGKQDNANGDKYNLVTVLYSITLFMLGIVGIFKKLPNRGIVVIIACVVFLFATIYMFSIPLPTGFSIANFFKG